MAYKYKGIRMLKNPFDLGLYQSLLWSLLPKTIIEVGSHSGGSAVWFADILSNYGIEPKIISIDIHRVEGINDNRIDFRKGDGRNLGDTLSEEELNSLPRPLLVIEDADHSYETCIAVLNFFSSVLKPGEYIVIEDGIVEAMGMAKKFNGGPCRAIDEFIQNRGEEFVIDHQLCDYYGFNVTWNTNGFIRRR